MRLADIAEHEGDWWPPARLGAFLSSLSPVQEGRVNGYQRREEPGFYGAFRRTKKGRGGLGGPRRRESRRSPHDAGRLRQAGDPPGRQGGGGLAVRWMSVTEYARLQGAEGMDYAGVTPQQAMFALGDAVCVPVIEWLAQRCLSPRLP